MTTPTTTSSSRRFPKGLLVLTHVALLAALSLRNSYQQIHPAVGTLRNLASERLPSFISVAVEGKIMNAADDRSVESDSAPTEAEEKRSGEEMERQNTSTTSSVGMTITSQAGNILEGHLRQDPEASNVSPEKTERTKTSYTLPVEPSPPPEASHDASKNANTISMIVHLRGQLGNHLSLLVHAYAVKRALEERYASHHLKIRLVGQHQDLERKWEPTTRILQRCFPALRDGKFDFEGGIWDDKFVSAAAQQEAWILNSPDMSHRRNRNDRGDLLALHVDEACSEMGNCWESVGEQLQNMLSEQSEHPDKLEIQPAANSTYSLPHLHLTKMPTIFDPLLERYYDEIREWLRFDTEACCDQIPAPDTTVLHVRNFKAEGKRLLGKGYHELDANQVASLLLSDLEPASHVDIVSRSSRGLYEYKAALEQKRGVTVSVVMGQQDEQDFCYLHQASGHIAGNLKSTFATMAAFLGTPKQRVQLYTVDSYYTRRKGDPGLQFKLRDQEVFSSRSEIEFPIYQDDRYDLCETHRVVGNHTCG